MATSEPPGALELVVATEAVAPRVAGAANGETPAARPARSGTPDKLVTRPAAPALERAPDRDEADAPSGMVSTSVPGESGWEEKVERDGFELPIDDGVERVADTIDGSRGAEGDPPPEDDGVVPVSPDG